MTPVDDAGLLAERPAEVVRGAGVWLAGRLDAHGFGWRASAGTSERRDGDRRERIHLHGSAWNRAGDVIAFQVMVTVTDRRVRAWRRAHPGLTLDPDGSDRVRGHPLVMLTGSAERFDGPTVRSQPVSLAEWLVSLGLRGLVPWHVEI